MIDVAIAILIAFVIVVAVATVVEVCAAHEAEEADRD